MKRYSGQIDEACNGNNCSFSNSAFSIKVREIRRAVLLNRTADDCDSDTEWENQEVDSQATGTVATPRPGMIFRFGLLQIWNIPVR